MRIGTIGFCGLLSVLALLWLRDGGMRHGWAQAPPAKAAVETGRPLPAELYAPIDVTPKDENVEKLLATKITFELKETPLDQAIEQIRKRVSANLIFDRAALVKHFFDLTKPVTLQVQDVPVRRVLKLILQPFGLACIVRDGILVITDEDDVEINLQARLYPVADLVGSTPPEHMDVVVDELIDIIQNTIKPDTWDENGGSGGMEFASMTLTLVVRTTEDTHERVQVFLAKLREAQQRARAQLQAAGLPELGALQKALHEARQSSVQRLADQIRPEPPPPPSEEIAELRQQAANAQRVAEKALRLALELEKELAHRKAQPAPAPAPAAPKM